MTEKLEPQYEGGVQEDCRDWKIDPQVQRVSDFSLAMPLRDPSWRETHTIFSPVIPWLVLGRGQMDPLAACQEAHNIPRDWVEIVLPHPWIDGGPKAKERNIRGDLLYACKTEDAGQVLNFVRSIVVVYQDAGQDALLRVRQQTLTVPLLLFGHVVEVTVEAMALQSDVDSIYYKRKVSPQLSAESPSYYPAVSRAMYDEKLRSFIPLIGG